ncbi:MAG: hypothetical protein LBS49_07410 [Candidatus Accumulibacter sp.]|nr:hypothetical protein [Accumulibacter sp.]
MTISIWKKVNATSIRPARCPSCGGLSYVSGWYHALVSLLLEVATWGSLIAALVLRSWYALLLWPLGVALVFLLQASGARLRATDAAAVSRARKRCVVELLVFAGAMAAVYVLFGE